jgi:serine/threonine protein kinase
MATGETVDRTLAALSLAIGDGHRLDAVDIDLSNPEHCRFGAYTLLEPIGRGGAGLVFRARQESLERDVAIKLLNVRLVDEAIRARFNFEARSAAALNHPNIVQILEIGEQQGVGYIAMQLVRGPSLADAIAEGLPSTQRAVDWMLKLCDAVGYAHGLKLLHLDLKPANVLLDERGEPLVADFGLARRMNEAGEVQAQEVSGTPAYMAPEQVLIKEFRLSAATDIYALGAILYEMLCGRSPHGRGAVADVMQRALAGQVPLPRSLRPEIPRDLEAICMKCLALRAGDRYPNVQALADDLRRFAAGLQVSVRPLGGVERFRRWFAREPKFAAAMAALLVAAVGGGITFAHLYRQADRERAGAEGMARLIMNETSEEEAPILPKQESGWRTPVVDCTLRGKWCASTGFNPFSGFDNQLPMSQRQKYVASLRDYVPRLQAWGHPNLSRQLGRALDEFAGGLAGPDVAKRAAATGTQKGYLFAFFLGHDLDDSSLDPLLVKDWFDRAAAGATAPGEIHVLAESCDRSWPSCVRIANRFRETQPDNVPAWLMDLPQTPGPEGDARLENAARAANWTTHQDEFLAAALAFARSLGPYRVDDKLSLAPEGIALFSWYHTGVVGYPTKYCQQAFEERDAPQVEAACRRIFERVGPAMKPTLLDEIVAAVVLVRISAPGPEHDRAWQRLRDDRWVYSAWEQLSPRTTPDAAATLDEVRRMGEFGHFREEMRRAGLPLTAPEEFVTREPLPWVRKQPRDESALAAR